MNLLETEIKKFDKKIIKKDELFNIISEQFEHYKESSFNWTIYKLEKKQIITKLDSENFFCGFLKKYNFVPLSKITEELTERFKKDFSDINIAIYETSILNEWVNQLVSRNIIIVEVEKFFAKDVFRYIQNIYPSVFYNPSKEDLDLYKDVKIIVNNLVTQAPINQKDKTIKIEKLIVDLFTNDNINEFISESEKEEVAEAIFKTYAVNVKTILAYAKRRNNYDAIKSMLSKFKTKDELQNDIEINFSSEKHRKD